MLLDLREGEERGVREEEGVWEEVGRGEGSTPVFVQICNCFIFVLVIATSCLVLFSLIIHEVLLRGHNF
jgi:hypothetical protein